MDGLNTWLTIFLNHLNAGLALGVVLAVLLLLRPLLLRLLTPQQRVAVWYVAGSTPWSCPAGKLRRWS